MASAGGGAGVTDERGSGETAWSSLGSFGLGLAASSSSGCIGLNSARSRKTDSHVTRGETQAGLESVFLKAVGRSSTEGLGSQSVRPRETESHAAGGGSLATNESGMVGWLIQVRALFQELKQPKVRSNFLVGNILKTEDPEMVLVLLDHINSIIFPTWTSHRETRETQTSAASTHIGLLYSQSPRFFEVFLGDVDVEVYSYATWAKAIDRILRNSYWESSSSTNVGLESEFLGLTSDANDLLGETPVKVKSRRCTFAGEHPCSSSVGVTGSSRRVAFRDDCETPLYSAFGAGWGKSMRSGRKSIIPATVETIEVSDTSDEDSDRESSDSSCRGRHSSRRFYPKDVVLPEKFEIDGKQSLKTFLEGYERYFRAKYDGTQRECTQELARFIGGEVRQAYDALGGPQRKYRDLKPALLQWYKAQSMGRISQYKAEFKKLSMREGESLKLYCMRLQEVASRAFPNDERECVKQMKRKILSSTPTWFCKCIEKREDMKVMLHLGKRVTWGEIIEIAEQQDKKRRKVTLFEGSDDELQSRYDKLKCQMLQTPKTPTGSRGKLVTNSRYGGALYRSMTCEFCGRRGHSVDRCWTKMGACVICGSMEHQFADCPKYFPDYRGAAPRCISCAGPHLARDCPKQSSNC